MKVQLVANEAGEVANQFRPDDADLEDLNYQGGDEAPGGFMNGHKSEPEAPARGRMSMGPPRDVEDRQMNRAQRRKMEKDVRKR